MIVVYSRAETAPDESSVYFFDLLTLFYFTILIEDFLVLVDISYLELQLLAYFFFC